MPEGPVEETCSAKKHQGAWIPSSIVLCVLHLPPRREQANTFINTSALDINRALQGREKKKGAEQRHGSLSVEQKRASLKLGELCTKSDNIKGSVVCLFI